MKKIVLSAMLVFLFFSPSLSFSVVRGAPEGKPRVEVGDAAPLEHEELQKIHKEGKGIILLFGNPSDCGYCEKTYIGIQEILPKYEKDVGFVVIVHRPWMFWKPAERDKALAEKYGVIGEPWIFLIDKEGIVRRIFMGFPEIKDVEDGIKELIKPKQ